LTERFLKRRNNHESRYREQSRAWTREKYNVVEVRKKSLIAPAQDAFIQLGINVLVTVKGTIKYIEPKEKK